MNPLIKLIKALRNYDLTVVTSNVHVEYLEQNLYVVVQLFHGHKHDGYLKKGKNVLS
jgi:hypothetical protein